VACVLFVRCGPFWSEGERMNSVAALAADALQITTPEEFCEAVKTREQKRHATSMAGIEKMTKRLKTGKAKDLGTRDANLRRIFQLRNEYVEIVSAGHFADAASREWKRIPLDWRKAFLVKAGIGMDVTDLTPLASRSWQEFPPPERDAVRSVIREVRTLVPKLCALGARE